MKRSTIAFALILSLLSIAAVGFHGCGKKNTITSITVTPADPFIAKGTVLKLSVTAHFSDGMSLTSWTQITWQSSDTTVATVSGTGLVSAVSEGTAVITAIDKAHPSITYSITAIVTALQSITINPPSASIASSPVGTVQFTATGIYSDLTPSAWSPIWPPDVTTLVTWESSSTDIAVISNVAGSNGIATAGTTTGTTTITAKATGPTGTVITGTATLTVDP